VADFELLVVIMEEMRAGQEEMKATVRAVQEKMETAVRASQ
jgi:hypothetical protein